MFTGLAGHYCKQNEEINVAHRGKVIALNLAATKRKRRKKGRFGLEAFEPFAADKARGREQEWANHSPNHSEALPEMFTTPLLWFVIRGLPVITLSEITARRTDSPNSICGLFS